MQDDLRWDDLRGFLAVARGGTLKAASEVLDVNASTVHRRISALEQALGARLFERDPRGYSLTPLGELLVPRAEEVEAAVQGLRRGVLGYDQSVEGTVRLTLPEDLLGVVGPHLVAFRREHPRLDLRLLTDARLLDLRREADLAVRAGAAPPEVAIARKAGRVRWARYTSSDAEACWVLYDGLELSAVRWRRRVHPDPEVLAQVTSVSAMHRMLQVIDAQGLLPTYLGESTPGLVRIGEPIDEAEVDLWLLVHADLRRSARVRAVVEALLPALRADPCLG